ncbi:MAG TPA: PilZ domain-containing protein [Polyangiaceae bacterium]
MSTEDRRAPGATRIPFDGLVEVGGAMGPSFEAQAINISEDGMLLRTAYLPEPGQPLTCRFDAGPGEGVLASGEVVWSQGAEKGGEFAIRFTDMDPQSVEALKRACGVGVDAQPLAQAGTKVRLHIEGLASPMRAKIKDAHSSEITVGSDLGFLQVGRHLELEDAASGGKRPACIDRVEVAVDPTSHVPQLVVTLRYEDVEAEERAPRPAAPSIAPKETATAARAADDDADAMEASIKMKGTIAHGIARIGPAIEKLANRAKTTIALLAARRSLRGEDPSMPRRTTAPAPGGGLHAAGRRVVRGEQTSGTDEAPATSKLKLTRRKAAIASAVMITAIIGAVAMKKSHHDASPEAAAPASTETRAAAPTAVAAETTPVPPFPTQAPMPIAPPMDTAALQGSSGGISGGMASADDDSDTSTKSGHKHHGKVAPFGNGPVHHGNVLHLKMDGPIEAIEGAQQPTGFAVKIPGRKSLEAAGPLAARDSRIAAIKVSNDPAGAELTIAFKDGVPNYRVDGKGDTLIINLAPVGSLDKTVAKNDPKGSKGAKHAHHDHKKAEKH